MDRLLTTYDVAQILQIHDQKVRDLCRDGKIPGFIEIDGEVLWLR